MTIDSIILFLDKSVGAVLSPHFFFLIGMGLLLLQTRISNKTYNILFYFSTFTYFLLFHANSLQIFRMAGDNICQIAYWKILFNSSLTGSIGASYTKPGQLLILGSLFELSNIYGEAIFRTGLCLIMAACVWSLVRIATDIGGREAGFLAFLISTLAFRSEFLAGSFSIFLVPTLFAGFWLYYHYNNKTTGRLLLASSLQYHIQVIPVLGVIWLMLAIKKEWKELGRFTLSVLISLTIWLLIILRVQGTMARVNGAGPAVGYMGPYGDSFVYGNKAEYFYKAVWSELSGSYSLAVLFVFIAIGIIGAWYYGFFQYLSVFSIIILLVANVLLLNGAINLSRQFAVFYAFGCSVGVGSLVRFSKHLLECFRVRWQNPIFSRMSLLVASTLFCVIISKQHLLPPNTQFVKSAAHLLADGYLPPASRLMTEDDLLYPVVVMAPERYKSLAALQQFNTATEPQRKDILARTDYIWVMLNGEHMYYYLNYLSDPTWRMDPFRQMVTAIKVSNRPGFLYGYQFIPVDQNPERLILKVVPPS